MIRIGNSPDAPHPVIVSLAKALGDALDRQQVAIIRAHLDETEPPLTDDNRCECCAIRFGGHGHFGMYCEPCADRPLASCDHGFGA